MHRQLCCGLTMFLWVWCGRSSRVLWQALLITGLAGFGTAIGVHFPIGYTTLTHLAPAYLGALMFAGGMVLTWPAMAGHYVYNRPSASLTGSSSV